MQDVSDSPPPEVSDEQVVYHLRDLHPELVHAWEDAFSAYPENFKVSKGDIFEGAPAVDAIVSPANSFGFMDGGIDYAYTVHFGQQMQKRLQEVIRTDYDGEVLVGQAAVIPAYDKDGRDKRKDWSKCNEGKAIKFLISAPTMRIPLNILDSANVYLAFRAVLLAVHKHNHTAGNEPIRSVLLPGLGTGVGRMPKVRCAQQMLQAYETFVKNAHPLRLAPKSLMNLYHDHINMCEYGEPPREEGQLRRTGNAAKN